MSLGQRDWLGAARYQTAAANAERKKSLLSFHLISAAIDVIFRLVTSFVDFFSALTYEIETWRLEDDEYDLYAPLPKIDKLYKKKFLTCWRKLTAKMLIE